MLIVSTSGKKGFHLEGNHQIGLEVVYKNWFSNKAAAAIGPNLIEIGQLDMWGNRFKIWSNGEEKGLIHFNWKGSIKIDFKDFWGIDRFFVLKQKSIWKPSYELWDEQDNLIFSIKPIYSWKRLKQTFEISDIRPNYHDVTLTELTYYSVYAIKIRMQKKAAAAS